jgi:hypothetical protein
VFGELRLGTALRWLPPAAVGLLLALGAATVAQAHVNRQVGPYTILVILVEEPTYEDNHAGFEFWVRRAQQPIVGLEGSIRAEATGHGERVDLQVPPIDGTGFYVLDRTAGGAPFDPLGGGAWSLRLSGDIEGTPLDEQFVVTFPSYPRVGAPKPVAGADSRPAPASPPAMGLLLVAGLGLGLLGAVIVASRRIRLRPAPPTLEPRR